MSLRSEVEKVLVEMREVAKGVDVDPYDDAANIAAYWLDLLEAAVEASEGEEARSRDAISGQFVSAEYAAENPDTTVTEES